MQIIRCWRFLGGEIGVGLAARPEGFKAARLVGLKISYRFLGFNRALQDNNLLSRLVCEGCRGTTWGLSLQAEEEGGL